MRIPIENFIGEIPRASARLLPDNAAQTAINCKMWSRELRPWRDLEAVNNPSKTGPIKSIYPLSAVSTYWMHWSEDVNVARGPIAGDTTKRSYYTGTDAPRVTDNVLVNTNPGTDYPTKSYKLGVPAPSTAPTVAVGGSGTGTAIARAYVYTLVTGWGEESAPSPVSAIVSVQVGQTVTVNNFATPPSGDYQFTHRRIYRVASGLTGAEYLFVAEITLATSSYVDSKTDIQLGEPLETTDWAVPPANMVGLIAMPNGVMAGFVGNQCYLSVPYAPYAYPVKYRQVTDFPIVALGNFGSTIVAATAGRPYIINGIDPAYAAPSQHPGILPCVSKRGLVSTEVGVLYPSSFGLVRVTPAGADVITLPIIDSDDWQEFKPETMHAVFYNGQYIAFYSTGVVNGITQGGGLIIDGIGKGEMHLTMLDFYRYGTFLDPDTNKLYMIDYNGTTNTIEQWEGSIHRKTYRWRSKIFKHRPLCLTAGKVSANYGAVLSAEQVAQYQAQHDAALAENAIRLPYGRGAVNAGAVNVYAVNAGDLLEVPEVPTAESSSVEVRVYGDGELIHTEAITNGRPFRIPDGTLRSTTEIELSGVAPVYEIVVAENVSELKDS